jgi:hypothetical protein
MALQLGKMMTKLWRIGGFRFVMGVPPVTILFIGSMTPAGVHPVRRGAFRIHENPSSYRGPPMTEENHSIPYYTPVIYIYAYMNLYGFIYDYGHPLVRRFVDEALVFLGVDWGNVMLHNVETSSQVFQQRRWDQRVTPDCQGAQEKSMGIDWKCNPQKDVIICMYVCIYQSINQSKSKSKSKSKSDLI